MSAEELALPENWEDQFEWDDDEEERGAEAPAATANSSQAEATLPFHNVAPAQLVLLSLATFGLYLLVWFYRNWVAFHRYRDGKPRHPMALLRTVFSPVLYWDLAWQIDTVGRKVGAPGSTHPMLVGPLFLVLVQLWRLPDPYSILMVFAVLPLLPAAVQIERVHAALRPGVDTRVRWGWGANVALVLGGTLWTLILLGTVVDLLPALLDA